MLPLLISNEEWREYYHPWPKERGYSFEDLTFELSAELFCSLSWQEVAALQEWLTRNAERHMRAEKHLRDEHEAEEQRYAEEERRLEREREKNAPPPMKPGWVYLIEAENGLFKIGRAKDLEQRVSTFETQFPVSVTLVHSIKSDYYIQAEKKLHEQYDAKRQHGEWFELDDSDIQVICSIGDGEI